MRNPDRINKFCDELKSIWHCVPDWRFGQLMSNALEAYVTKKKRDIFFPEDDELMEFLKEYIGENNPFGKDIK